MINVKSMWVFAAGVVLLLAFLFFFAFPLRPRLGPGGTRTPWLGPGGTRHLLGGSANAYHPYELFQDNPSTLYMIGVDWCPHCKTAKPGFMSMGATTTIGDQSVAFQYLDGEKDKDRLPPCEMGGFPTFCFLHKGKSHRYQGPRTPEGYMNFVQQILSGSGSGSA